MSRHSLRQGRRVLPLCCCNTTCKMVGRVQVANVTAGQPEAHFDMQDHRNDMRFTTLTAAAMAEHCPSIGGSASSMPDHRLTPTTF